MPLPDPEEYELSAPSHSVRYARQLCSYTLEEHHVQKNEAIEFLIQGFEYISSSIRREHLTAEFLDSFSVITATATAILESVGLDEADQSSIENSRNHALKSETLTTSIRDYLRTCKAMADRYRLRESIETELSDLRQRSIEDWSYEFSDEDLSRIQRLINELRELISETEEVEPDHRRRLLRRLEKLQSEMHKHMSDVDRVFGFAIEVSMVAGTIGEKAKPIVDRAREILDICNNAIRLTNKLIKGPDIFSIEDKSNRPEED